MGQLAEIKNFRNQYYFLSNFSLSLVYFEGNWYKSVESAFQAAKTLDPETREDFSRYDSSTAKRKGRLLKLRSDWNDVKKDIMLTLIREKFKKNPKLKLKLLETGSKQLIEGNTWGDIYWGMCKGVGENNLGKIVMQVRSEIQKEMSGR